MPPESQNSTGESPVQLPPGLAAALARALHNVAISDNPALTEGLAAIYDACPADDGRLLDINKIGAAVFGDPVPSKRTLQDMTKRGLMPYFKIGRLVRYDPRLVRAALEAKCLVHAKKSANRNVSRT